MVREKQAGREAPAGAALVLPAPFAYDLGVLSFAYQYLVGGLVFALGLRLVLGGGELGWRGRPGTRLAVLLIGLAALALLQGLLQWASGA